MGDETAKCLSSLFGSLINSGILKDLGEHMAHFCLQNIHDILFCHRLILWKELLHPVCMLFDGRFAADILTFYNLGCQK